MTEQGRSMRWGRFGAATLPLLVAFALAFSVPGVAAQDGTPEAAADEGRPVHIHTGSCGEDELGDVIQPLSNLLEAAGDIGGNDAAVPAETSFTNVPLVLEDILAEDHAINAHLSTEEVGTYIACGEVGGPVAEDGSLSIALKQQSDSGFTGIAFLSPGDDEATTDVSVFIAPAITGEEDEATEDEDEATEEAAADEEDEQEDATPVAEGEAVEVVLTEWELDMPDTLAAGLTTFTLVNDGEFPHTIAIEGEGVEEGAEVVDSGDEGTYQIELEAGTYTFYCPVGNGRHREEGMELEVTVE